MLRPLAYEKHLTRLMHIFVIIFFVGCTTQSSGNPQPNECNVCRVAKDPATGNCLPECEEPNYLTPNNFCVDKSCKSLIFAPSHRRFFKHSIEDSFPILGPKLREQKRFFGG